jgi:hypothetical protein
MTGRSNEERWGGCFLEGSIITSILYVIIYYRFLVTPKQKVDLDENPSEAMHTPGVASIRMQWGATFYRRRSVAELPRAMQRPSGLGVDHAG